MMVRTRAVTCKEPQLRNFPRSVMASRLRHLRQLRNQSLHSLEMQALLLKPKTRTSLDLSSTYSQTSCLICWSSLRFLHPRLTMSLRPSSRLSSRWANLRILWSIFAPLQIESLTKRAWKKFWNLVLLRFNYKQLE